MANIAIIFAGGTGKRMNTKSIPKQFLELHGKPILVYTLEQFNNHPEIDSIILVVQERWVDYCKNLTLKYHLEKISAIEKGGVTAFESQRNGLKRASEMFSEKSIVLIHDGVRPLIDEDTISRDIESVKNYGNAITVSPATETIMVKTNDETGEVDQIIDRSKCELARAPQGFYLQDILEAHKQAKKEGLEFIDSATMMQYYGHHLYTVVGRPENIKITTPDDFYSFRALVDARENSQIFGI